MRCLFSIGTLFKRVEKSPGPKTLGFFTIIEACTYATCLGRHRCQRPLLVLNKCEESDCLKYACVSGESIYGHCIHFPNCLICWSEWFVIWKMGALQHAKAAATYSSVDVNVRRHRIRSADTQRTQRSRVYLVPRCNIFVFKHWSKCPPSPPPLPPSPLSVLYMFPAALHLLSRKNHWLVKRVTKP